MTDKILADLEILSSGGFENISHIAAEAARTIRELDAIKCQGGSPNSWRGIAAAMGYEPKAHLNVRPLSKWLKDRVAMYRAQVVEEHTAPILAELEAVKAERDRLQVAIDCALDNERLHGLLIYRVLDPLREYESKPLPKVGEVYQHRSDPGSTYRVLAVHEDVHSQYEGEWHPTVEYDRDSAFTSRRFTCTVKEFMQKFVRARSNSGRVYLIRKGGAYYRSAAEGYTTDRNQAGLYTREEAERHSHPNGPDGPRDGIRYYHVNDLRTPL